MMVVGVSGKAGVGKDVFGSIAVKEYGATLIAFAAGVKEEVSDFLRSIECVFEHRHLWGTQHDKEATLRMRHSEVYKVDFIQPFLTDYAKYGNGYWYFTPRSLCQWWGTEYRRAQDSEYWVKRAFAKCVDKDTLYVITDVRFPNEANGIRDTMIGDVVRINRPSAPNISNMDHPSEVALDDYKFWDFVINNEGTLEEYEEKCRIVLDTLAEEAKW